MKQHYVKLALLLLCSSAMFAQTIEKMYIDMPAFINPILSSRQRMEMIEYAKVGQVDSIKNQFERNAQLQYLDLKNQCIGVAHTDASLFEMRLFFTEEKSDSLDFVAIVETVCAPICSSTVTLYSPNWNKLRTIKTDFTATDFLDVQKLQEATLLEEAIAQLPAIFIQATIDKESGDFVYSNNTILQLSPDEQEKLMPYIIPVRKTH